MFFNLDLFVISFSFLLCVSLESLFFFRPFLCAAVCVCIHSPQEMKENITTHHFAPIAPSSSLFSLLLLFVPVLLLLLLLLHHKGRRRSFFGIKNERNRRRRRRKSTFFFFFPSYTSSSFSLRGRSGAGGWVAAKNNNTGISPRWRRCRRPPRMRERSISTALPSPFSSLISQ